MCGASSEQTQTYNEQNAFYQTLNSEYSTVFAEDQGILTQLKNFFQPIIAAGPNQEGFNAAEKTALEGQVVEGTATNFANAHRALEENMPINETGVDSGEQRQLEAELAYSSAAEKSKEELGIVQADYAAGKSLFDEAVAAEESTAGLLNPEGFAGQTTNAGNASSKTANDIATAENSWMAPVFGAIGGLGGAAFGPHPH